MELTVKQTNWSANGNVVFEKDNWSFEIHITWLLIDVMIRTFPVVFVIAAAYVSDGRLDCITEFPNFEYEKKKHVIVKPEMVRAELQFQELSTDTDAATMFHLKCEFEWGNSETKPKQVINSMDELNSFQHILSTRSANCFTQEEKERCIFLKPDVDTTARLDEMPAYRETIKDSLLNIVPSSSESLPALLKQLASDFSLDESWDDDFKGIHEDGLHMPKKLWNDPNSYDMKPEKDHLQSLEQPKVMQVETENETIVIRKHKESLSEIRKDCSHSSDSEESSILEGSQRGKKVEQNNDEYISASGSQIFQSKDRFSTIQEKNKCNIVEKSTSEIGIQVEMTEEMDNSHMVVGTCVASSEHIAMSYPEKVKSKKGSAEELPTVFVSVDEEIGLPESHTKEVVIDGSGRCFVGPKYDAEKQVTEENLENLRTSLTNQDEGYLNLEIEDLRALEESSIQVSEKKMNEFIEETYERELQFRTDEDSNSERKPEDSNSEGKPDDISGKFCDDLIPIEDKKELKPVQDNFADHVISFKAEEEYQQIHPHNLEEHDKELYFKMKSLKNTDNVKKAHAYRYTQEELALILQTYFGGTSTIGRNMPKEDKYKKDESHYKKDKTSHYEFELLKEIISTWYFFPMLGRFMEFCLPSSLQAFFERMINGPPISLAERMSYEWLRLQSFSTLPSSTWGTAIRLARSGFYYTGQGTHIRCFACNVEHEGWNNTDNPHEVHMRMSPNCPFLGGNPTYPNFPIIPDTVHSGNNTERSGSSATPMIPVVQERTQSRVPEPEPVIIPSINHSSTLHLDEMSVPPSAVTNGYHQVPSETVQVEARRENAETQGSSVSRKQQQTNSNPSTGTSQPESSPTSSSLIHPQQPTIDAENTQYTSPGNFVLKIPTRQVEDPGVDSTPQTMSERPKHPEYAPLSSRINSYTSWPTRLDQTPQQMAEAGFFYAGIMDYTRCFQCGGGLRNWEPGDNPWIEHARWYPQCAYVLGKRGQKFVNAVLKKQAELLAAQNAERNNSCGTTTATTTTTTTIISGTGTSSESQSVQQPISQSGLPRYFQNSNENDIAKKLIEEMGYQRERVREAILEVKRRRGQQEITIEHAIDLLLADEERRGRAGRQNEAATMEELIQESGRLTLHDDSSPPPTATANTTAPPPQTTTTTESCQCSGHPHQVAGVRSSGQQQSGQTNQSAGLGKVSSVPQSRQNTSGPMSIAVDVPSSSLSFDNREGHQSSKSTAANRPSSPPLLQAISLPAIDAESLREEYLRLRDQNVCKICMERNIELAFLPCGHLVCCEVCGKALRFCPICRAKINASVKTYLS